MIIDIISLAISSLGTVFGAIGLYLALRKPGDSDDEKNRSE